MIVDGSNNNIDTCGEEPLGIYYQNAGAKITNDMAQNQLLPPVTEGCQNGEGIFVENQTSGTPSLASSKNTVTNFDKNGIAVSCSGGITYIDEYTLTGAGPIDWIAKNGIQMGYGASGHIKGNTVSNLCSAAHACHAELVS